MLNHRNNRMLILVLYFLAIAVLSGYAWNSGYILGKDLAEKENQNGKND
jgi:hypothetical protein